MIRTEEEHLAHYGILRRSGRYPWGSGGSESTRNRSFLDYVDMHKKEGMSESKIAEGVGITTTQLRAAKFIATSQQRQEKQLTAQRLKEKGWGNSEIGRRMGLNESSVRALLAPGAQDKAFAVHTTANMLKKQVATKGMVQIGSGVENSIGVTKTHLDNAVAILQEEGYQVHTIKVQQVTTGNFTNVKVLAKPGTTLSEVQRNRGDIKLIDDHSEDYGRSFQGPQPPISISSRRIGVNYKEDGGAEADGVIYVRPGVDDVRLGGSQYAQVRISVDGTHYLKGMAVYKDDLPAGKDLVFNTNKSYTGRKKDVMKEMEKDSNGNVDPNNPFGATFRQIHDDKGKVSSVMNKVNEEGDWDNWSRSLSSQVLSKQNPALAKQQLNLTYDRRTREFNEISSLTNPTVRKDLLLKFADSTDSSAAHLDAAQLPRQATKVLLPIKSIKETEIYAPSMRNGERVVLIRFPHGGTFEIPELTVNNRNREARKILGTSAQDAVGIHHKVAQHLSGADFDGDFVLVIPNNRGSIKKTPALEGLKGFDPQVYKIPEDSPIPRITSGRKQHEMGNISNLITDMTINGASSDELAAAVRHSMVVIDSEKHGLDLVQSEKDNGIKNLKEKYQGSKKAGAATLISRAGSPIHLPQRRARPASRGGAIDPVTGKKVFEDTGFMIPVISKKADPVSGKRLPTGEMVPKTEKHKRLAVTDNALELVSPANTLIERTYAEHSNKLKALANTARKEAVNTKGITRSPSAAKVYANEVASMDAKLNLAKKNRPLEKQAQLLANLQVSQKRQANPGMEQADVKKIKNQALNEARLRTGAGKNKIILTQSEWDAIQAGAISNHKLEEILSNSNIDTVKALALPKHTPKLTNSMVARAKTMLASGYTQAEVADKFGIGLTTLKVSISE